jgi:hypothetical protein
MWFSDCDDGSTSSVGHQIKSTRLDTSRISGSRASAEHRSEDMIRRKPSSGDRDRLKLSSP